MEKTLEVKDLFTCNVTCVDEQGHVWLGGSGYGDILYFQRITAIPFLLSRLLWKSTIGPQYLLLTCSTFTTE